MTRARTLLGLALAAAFAGGAAAGYLALPRPQSFAECLLVNAREAQTAEAIPAIAQACESLHPGTAKTFGDVADVSRGEGIHASR